MNVKQSVKKIETSVHAMTTMVSIHGLAQDEKWIVKSVIAKQD